MAFGGELIMAKSLDHPTAMVDERVQAAHNYVLISPELRLSAANAGLCCILQLLMVGAGFGDQIRSV